MPANIATIRDNADAIHSAEAALSAALHELSLTAEYGHRAVSEAIRLIEESRSHANRAVVAAAAGNALMAAKHEAQAVIAASDAAHALDRAGTYADDLAAGLEAATGGAGSSIGHAQSLVKLDDSSPAAEIHTKIAAQAEALEAMRQRVHEIRHHVPGSRDPDDLRLAAEHFAALREELDESAGRAYNIALDSSGYASSV